MRKLEDRPVQMGLKENMPEEFVDYWTSPKVVLKCVGPKLVPFFKTVAIFFVLSLPKESPSWFSCLIKCLPIISLCVFVVMHGMSLGEKHAYSRRVLFGLIFSCLGDAFLVWPCCLIYGMGAFAIAHILYIFAFGMHPHNPYAGTVCFFVTLIGCSVLYPGLYGPFTLAVPGYIGLLMFMVWRAVARVQLFEDLWTWTKLCSCGGGILFALSDFLIGLNLFRFSLPYAHNLTMVSYYAAQLGIALSVVDSKAMAVLSAAQSANAGPQVAPCCTPLKERTSIAALPVSSGNVSRRNGPSKEHMASTSSMDYHNDKDK